MAKQNIFETILKVHMHLLLKICERFMIFNVEARARKNCIQLYIHSVRKKSSLKLLVYLLSILDRFIRFNLSLTRNASPLIKGVY